MRRTWSPCPHGADLVSQPHACCRWGKDRSQPWPWEPQEDGATRARPLSRVRNEQPAGTAVAAVFWECLGGVTLSPRL